MANIPIGLQLYSVREDAAKDLSGVLKRVAQMGYAGVEFAGYYGHSAPDVRKMLDDNGLKCCGTHTPLITLQGDALKHTVDLHKELGNKFEIPTFRVGNHSIGKRRGGQMADVIVVDLPDSLAMNSPFRCDLIQSDSFAIVDAAIFKYSV